MAPKDEDQRSGLTDAAGRAVFFPARAWRGPPDFLAGTVVLYEDTRA